MKANVLLCEHERGEEFLHNPRRRLQGVIDYHREDKFLPRLVHEVTGIAFKGRLYAIKPFPA